MHLAFYRLKVNVACFTMTFYWTVVTNLDRSLLIQMSHLTIAFVTINTHSDTYKPMIYTNYRCLLGAMLGR